MAWMKSAPSSYYPWELYNLGWSFKFERTYLPPLDPAGVGNTVCLLDGRQVTSEPGDSQDVFDQAKIAFSANALP